MKKAIFCAVILLGFMSCQQKKDETAKTTPVPVEKDSSSFFPVTSFIRGQLLELDSLPITVLQLKTIGKKTDSSWLKKEQIRPILEPFISPEIRTDNLNSFFKQTKFNDQTIAAITFTYDPLTTLPDSIQIRHWDVYIQPETGKVKKVYLLKQLNKDGKQYIQQLTWQTDKWAKIVTILTKPGGNDEVESEIKLVWDFNQ